MKVDLVVILLGDSKINFARKEGSMKQRKNWIVEVLDDARGR